MNLRVTVSSEDKCHETRIRSESEPEEGGFGLFLARAHLACVKLEVVDAKPSDLHMSRMKSG